MSPLFLLLPIAVCLCCAVAPMASLIEDARNKIHVDRADAAFLLAMSGGSFAAAAVGLWFLLAPALWGVA